MNETMISWTQLTWNPMSGCTKISEECKHCYAEQLAEDKRGTAAFPNGFDLTFRPHKLAEPGRIKEPSLIFCNSMSDPGLPEIPDAYRARIFDAIEAAPRHRYQMLTKRPDVLYDWMRRTGRRVPASVWMGVTLGHANRVERLDVLRRFRDLSATVLFVSAEPLLSHLPISLDGIDWIITGGESGRHASDPKELAARFLVRRGARGEANWVPREDRADWVRVIRDEADRAGAAHWFKQWGGPRPESGGRILDGRTHDGMPTHISGAMPLGYAHKAMVPKGADKVRLPVVSAQRPSTINVV